MTKARLVLFAIITAVAILAANHSEREADHAQTPLYSTDFQEGTSYAVLQQEALGQ